jgi:hypothetical protein
MNKEKEFKYRESLMLTRVLEIIDGAGNTSVLNGAVHYILPEERLEAIRILVELRDHCESGFCICKDEVDGES